MSIWNRIYRFEIDFANGKLDSRTCGKVDQQRPPASLGAAVSVKLIPLVEGYPPVFYPIPFAEGVSPVCHVHRSAGAETPNEIDAEWFRVGFSFEGNRSMIAVEVGSKTVSAWFDNNGPS